MQEEIQAVYRVQRGIIIGGNQPPPSTIDAQKHEIRFLYAENNDVYGVHPYQQLDERGAPIEDTGKWMIFRNREDVDGAWETIKGGVREGIFYDCKVGTVNESFTNHIICVGSLCYHDIPDLVEKYNALVEKGLVKPDESIHFKTDLQTKKLQEGEYFYISDDLPGLLLNYLKERLEYLRSKNALSQDKLTEFENIVADLELHINNEKKNNASVGVILQAEVVKIAVAKAKQLPEQVFNFCKFDNQQTEEASLNRIDRDRKKATPHMFFEMERVKDLIDVSYQFSNDEPAYLLKNLRYKISLLPEDSDFRKSLEKLENKLSKAVQKQRDDNVPMEQIMESRAIQCTKETLRLVQTVTSDGSPENKMNAIQGYENLCCKKTSIFANFAKAAAFVVITALGFLLGATIGALVGIIAGVWTGPGAAASAVLGLAKGAIDGAAVGVVVAAAVTGISSGALGRYLLFKPESTKTVANKAKEFVQQEEENPNNNLNI